MFPEQSRYKFHIKNYFYLEEWEELITKSVSAGLSPSEGSGEYHWIRANI